MDLVYTVLMFVALPFIMIIVAKYFTWAWNLAMTVDRRYKHRKYDRLKIQRDKFLDMRNQARDTKTLADANLAISKIEEQMKGLLW